MVGDAPLFLSLLPGAAGCASPSRRHSGARPSLSSRQQVSAVLSLPHEEARHCGRSSARLRGWGLMLDRPQPPGTGGDIAPRDGRGEGAHPAGARYPHLTPMTRQGKSNGLKSTIVAPPAELKQPLSLPNLPFPTALASTLSINNTLNCMASVWSGWGTQFCCPQNPSPFPTGSRVQSPLPQGPGNPSDGGGGRNTGPRANCKTL